ncbi:PREDICTED: cell adhesion molecule 1-like [Ceratosolen solmsi marchali]|uniref:Cell adhesion molecule 1-like n=1 Tax=Ceratosolen solmsi marchali TaxID=326594 RepID=A0AAJ6YWP5_9HYME|nr:PREDICTED: cell adhesion molecule 1-like [Ceratosolen solmsi marchali]
MDNTTEKLQRLIICLLILVVGGSTSLKNLKITVPERVRVGDSALLTCSYDLEDAHLYAIKWYLDEEEFYRFVPKNEPPHDTFQVRNIQVNVSSSNMQDVTLVNVQNNHTGRYKCEVTEDIPRYDTKLQEADVLVVDVPETEPRIAVDRLHLPAGEKLQANCTSGASRPAPNITWTLNGAPVSINSPSQLSLIQKAT